MISIAADTIRLTSTSLQFGCVVRGPKGSWVRFAILDVPLDDIEDELMLMLATARRGPLQSDQPLPGMG